MTVRIAKSRDDVEGKASLRIVFLLLAPLIVSSSALAQTADWGAVENLQPGTPIFVKAQKDYTCWVERVTASELVCSVPELFSRSSITIPRSEVREVCLERDKKKYTATGAAIGATAGAIVGANANTNTRRSRVTGALAGGLAGGFVGGATGNAIATFRKGKVIFKR
jgi:uncharacterized protein YcfJ